MREMHSVLRRFMTVYWLTWVVREGGGGSSPWTAELTKFSKSSSILNPFTSFHPGLSGLSPPPPPTPDGEKKGCYNS